MKALKASLGGTSAESVGLETRDSGYFFRNLKSHYSLGRSPSSRDTKGITVTDTGHSNSWVYEMRFLQTACTTVVRGLETQPVTATYCLRPWVSKQAQLSVTVPQHLFQSSWQNWGLESSNPQGGIKSKSHKRPTLELG